MRDVILVFSLKGRELSNSKAKDCPAKQAATSAILGKQQQGCDAYLPSSLKKVLGGKKRKLHLTDR